MRALVWICALIAVALALYPSVSSAWNRHLAEGQKSEVADVYNDLDSPERLAVLEQAKAYNEVVAGRNPGITPVEYEKQLDYRGRAEIAWLEFPAANASMAVYRGAGDSQLAAGAGHLEGTALPVGGPGTRCVISAHSGMTGKYLLDGLTDVKEGDVFTVWTLGEPYTYRVIETREVEPTEVEALEPVKGRDLCTLVTCTSSEQYGIQFTRLNDLRLLVTGERCAREEAEAQGAALTGMSQEERARNAVLVAIAIAAIGAVVALGAMALEKRRRRKESMR